MCNQLRDFVKNYALIERRLIRLYKLSQPKHRDTTKVTKQISSSVILKWDSDSNDAFEIMKKLLVML